ncbi:MAG: hypothetical protein RJB42_934 [Bacteroidota bacterium]
MCFGWWSLRKARKLVLVSGVLFYLCAASTPAYSWGFWGHRYINYNAVFLLPPSMFGFYKQHIGYLTEHAADADMRRYAIKEEAPRHYIDLDQYHKNDSSRIPVQWQDAVNRFSVDSLNAHGIVPWWIMVMHQRLKRAFAEKDMQLVLKLSADIGHYIADAHVPLHASSNHNGQKTDQLGIHAFWESRLPELFAEKQYDLLLGRADYLKEPLPFIWERVYESGAAADTVLSMEKDLSRMFADHERMSFEYRNNRLVRQYSEKYAARYHKQLNGMVERRMRASIYAIASFWYTAWVEAGQPDLPFNTPSN